MKKYDIYCFSGTGNTFLAARKIKEVLESLGSSVEIRPLEKTDAGTVDGSSVLGIGFPVAVFSTYPFVWKFIDNLPSLPMGIEREVFVFDTMAGKSGGIKNAVKKTLRKKGYRLLGFEEIIMPSNFFVSRTEDQNLQCRDRGLSHAEEYAKRLHDGRVDWPKEGVLSPFFTYLARTSRPWKFMGKMIRIHEDKCTKCGLCAKLCPVGNIEMKEYPQKGRKCEVCMRCISFCPANAISIKNKFAVYRGVKAAEILGN